MIDQTGAMGSFLRQANAAFLAATGLPLARVRPEVERLRGDLSPMRALPARMAPDAYAAAVTAYCGFGVGRGAEGREANAAVLALVAHAADDPDRSWTVGGDGAIYAEARQGTVRVSPSADAGGGFDVHRIESAGAGGLPETLGEGLDLDEAVGLAEDKDDPKPGL